ncbi:MAG TPA: hypothetical protein VK610_01070 [Rhodothermales bacterium]|nr:hypothetical protein [Rhodothermales bacterium]
MPNTLPRPPLLAAFALTAALTFLGGLGLTVGLTACGSGTNGRARPADADVAAGVAAFYAEEAGLDGLHLAQTHLLALDTDPADAEAWVALVAVKGSFADHGRAFDDTLEVLLRPGTDRPWASEVRPLTAPASYVAP